MSDIEGLESLLAAGRDSATLRFGLGKAYLDAGDAVQAVQHLQRALILDPEYTAAWKLCGRALTEAGKTGEAVAAYEQGMRVANEHGDRQAQKEMQVFLQRLRTAQPQANGSSGEGQHET